MEAEHLLEQYKQAVDASTILSKTNLKGVITYANDEFCRVSKYSREELIGKPHNIVRHPSVPKAAFADLWQTIQAGKVWKGVVPNRAKDGTTYVVEATVFPITDASGAICEYIAIRKEITDYINKKSLLEQYRQAVDASNIVSKTDLKGVITYANDQFCRISKYSREELIGKPHNIVRHPDVPKEVFAELWDRIQAGHIWQGLVPNRAKDGSTYIVDATVMPIKNAQGQNTGYIAIRHDVTELIQRREEANKLEAEVSDKLAEAVDIQMESLMNAVGVPMALIDADDRVLAHNTAFLNLFELGSEDETLEALRAKTLRLSALFLPEPGCLTPNPLVDWKEMALDTTVQVALQCASEPKGFDLFLSRAPKEAARFVATLTAGGAGYAE
ncbi:MAG: PAS domain S-box protein [Campylobacterales bacterium]